MLPLILFILSLVQIHSQKVVPVKDPNNITISYGSCLNTFKDVSYITKVLTSIIRTEADVWMWIGDAIYLDGDTVYLGTLPGPGYDPSDEAYTLKIYNTLKKNPTYVQLINSMPIIGTWDDHDFASDDAGGEFKYKKRNMGIFLDFIDEPLTSPRRSQEGLYDSYYIGEAKLVKVILLDVRYFRTSDDLLGDTQWAWLDAQLQDNIPLYTVIASGSMYFPADAISGSWPEENLERLFDLIKAHKKSGVVLISGDVHYGQMTRHPCPARVGYNKFYELVSSGMTHSAAILNVFGILVKNKYSQSEDRYFKKNFALLRLISNHTNSTNTTNSTHTTITSPPDLIFEIRDNGGNVVVNRTIAYSDLVYNETLAASYNGCDL